MITDGREDLNRSDIGELVETLQEFKNRGSLSSQYASNLMVENYRLLLEENE